MIKFKKEITATCQTVDFRNLNLQIKQVENKLNPKVDLENF